MVSSLITHERIVTTVPKAKEVQRLAEKMVTLAKKQDLHNLRRAAAVVRGDTTLTKLFDILGPRYEHREGGYTRVMKLAKPRKGDNAPMAVIEYVDRPGEIRAARPPSKFQKLALSSKVNGLELALREMGIRPPEELVDADELKDLREVVENEQGNDKPTGQKP